MAHHKRKRSKKQRAGCLLCKPHKSTGIRWEKEPIVVRRKIQRGRDEEE